MSSLKLRHKRIFLAVNHILKFTIGPFLWSLLSCGWETVQVRRYQRAVCLLFNLRQWKSKPTLQNFCKLFPSIIPLNSVHNIMLTITTLQRHQPCNKHIFIFQIQNGAFYCSVWLSNARQDLTDCFNPSFLNTFLLCKVFVILLYIT